jgi:hypothetical protein
MKLDRLHTIEEYIKFRLNNQYDKRVIFIRNDGDPANLAGPTDGIEKIINAKCSDQLYITYSAKDDVDNNDIIVPQNLPILYYGGNNKDALRFLEKHNIKRENMYNKPEDMKISGSKIDFAKLFEKCDWLPKTVFSRDEAIDGAVGFPIIAKISDGHSGLGIKKFDTAKDLEKEPASFDLKGESREFDLYSQFIDFDREYRCFFIKDKCFTVNERVPIKDENKSIRTKKVDEKVKFIYAYQDNFKIPKEFFDEIYRISAELREEIKLDIWSLDIVVDKKGKMWVLETNSATGMGSVKLCDTYIKIFEDFYKLTLPNSYKEELWTKYISQGHFVYWPEFKEEIMSTLWPIDYEAIVEKYPLIDYEKE